MQCFKFNLFLVASEANIPSPRVFQGAHRDGFLWLPTSHSHFSTTCNANLSSSSIPSLFHLEEFQGLHSTVLQPFASIPLQAELLIKI